MNQPKLSIGDKVKCKKFNDVWVIHWINLGFHGYECMSEIKDGNYKSTNEKYLELYQEPKKKKLYAYKAFYTSSAGDTYFNGDVIRFFTNVDIPKFQSMDEEWKRAGEFDIEYPSEEVK